MTVTLALAVAAGLTSAADVPVARAAHNPAAPFSGTLLIVTDQDPRPAIFTLGVTSAEGAQGAFAAMGASPGAIPYAGCDPGPGAAAVYYAGRYQTSAGDAGAVAGCQESSGGAFRGWYRSSAQSTPNQAWAITLVVGGPTGGPGTYALPGELLPQRALTWEEARGPAPAPGGTGSCVGAGTFFEHAGAGAGEAQAPPAKTFCGVRALRDDVRAGVEGNTVTAGGASFTACLAYVLAAGAAGATIPFSGGATLTVAPWLLQAIGGTCAAAILTYGGFKLVGLRDDVVRSQTGTPRFEQEAGARADQAQGATSRIVLPRPRIARGAGLARACGRNPSRARCRRLADLAGRAVSASGTTASLAEAMAVSGGRALTAAAAGDGEHAAAQDAVAAAYAGALAKALVAQRRTSAAFARGLRAQGIDIRPSRGQVARVRTRLARMQRVPPAVLGRLRGDGFGAAQIRDAFRGLGAIPARPRSLTAVLSARVRPAGLAAAPDSVTVAQATAVVRALRAQGALPPGLAQALLDDLGRLGAAQGMDRAAAAARLAADARRATGRYGLVLRLVLEPLVSFAGP